MHFPVVNKQGDLVTSSVTTLDVHDMSRICRTYGVETLFVVTPLEVQRELVGQIIDHWQTGFGATYNPTRKEALGITRVTGTLQEAIAEVEEATGGTPQILVPDARRFPNVMSYPRARKMLQQGGVYLILFGTAWGLDPSQVERADIVLAPIEGRSGYRHLPVRAAAAVILDRLLGESRAGEGNSIETGDET